MADAEQAARAEWQRQTHATNPAQRSRALYVAVRAFQAALAIEGAEDVNDYLALCELLGEALDEYGEDDLDPAVDPIH
jgi:hypothetical protein